MKEKTDKRIVIAEDSLTQAMKLKGILENAGFAVYHGADGKQALSLVYEITPVIVISDIVMPEMDGFELCRKIKEDESLCRIPVILLTSLSELSDVIKGLECGTDSYIMKPFSEQYLLSRVNHVLENSSLKPVKSIPKGLNIKFGGHEFQIRSDPLQILNLLISTYDAAIQKNIELAEREKELILFNQTLQQKVEERKRELTVQLEEKIKAEEILKKSEEKYRELVDTALIGIYISTVEGKLLFANEAFRDMLDYSSFDELYSMNTSDLYKNPDSRNLFIGRLLKEGRVPDFETELITKNGSTKHVLLNATLEGDILSGMILDISDRKAAEQRMKNYQKELLQAKQKAEQSEKLKTAFLANMSNEILTPINSLVGFTDLLTRPGLSAESQAKYSGQINESGNQLLNLIDNIIDIAKFESGEVTIKLTDCRINNLLLDLYAYFEKRLHETGKDQVSLFLKRANKDNDFTILTEPYRLKKVLSNLLNNAIKFTETGAVEFGYNIVHEEENNDGSLIQFFIKDTGSGISQDKLTMIFDRFRRNDETYTKLSEGAGLGLPVSKAYVELLGGKIWTKSEIDSGTEFYFNLPYTPVKPDEGFEADVEVPVSTQNWENKKILIAEDIESNWRYLEAILQKTKASLIRVENGRQAIEAFKQHRDIDIILMDLRMPVMSGYDATIEIKKMNRDIPIIVQTAFARDEDKEKILETGCDSYIVKPVNNEVLLDLLGRFIKK